MRRAAAFTLLCACTPDGTYTYSPPEASTGAVNPGTPEPTTGTVPPPPPSTEDDTGGVGFIGDYEMGSLDVECSIWEQDCPEDEKCMPWANDAGNPWNATQCTPLDPNPGDLGDPCTVEDNGVSGVDTCKKRAMCWYVDVETLVGECIGLCIGSPNEPTCEDDFAECVIPSDGTLAICIPLCDPLDQDCSPDAGCVPLNDWFGCVPRTEDSAYGDPCEFVNHCAPGLFCANAAVVPGCEGSQGCCQHFCDLEQPAATQCIGYPLEDCLPWYDEGEAPHPEYENLGACAIPPP